MRGGAAQETTICWKGREMEKVDQPRVERNPKGGYGRGARGI